MSKNIQKIWVLGMVLSSAALFSQIKEEKLILDKKREPEVKKIEKKKTSVETIKNYPPEEKSQNPVQYQITNVPALSDFQTSTIQGEDITPKIEADQYQNYARFGMGNYGKVLLDGYATYQLNPQTEIGLDAHVLSTHGLKNEYPWNSRSSQADLSAFMNAYTNSGKINVTAGFGSQDYNYYGIYALEPAPDTVLKQQVQNFSLNGFYDHYSNKILNSAQVKTGILNDHFNAKESVASVKVNLSQHEMKFPLPDVTLNADLGVGFESVNSRFDLLEQHESNYFEGILEPKITFFRGKSYLMIGSGFSFLGVEQNNNLLTDRLKENKTYWFPKAEVLFASSPLANLYLGVDGGLQHNSYTEMLHRNPFLVSDQEVLPTETKYRLYFGIKGDVNEHVKYDVSAGFSEVRNIMFFKANGLFDHINTLNRSAYNYANTFSAVYDNGSVNEVKASVQYFPLQNLSLNAAMNYNFYRLDNHDKIYNIPEFNAEFGGQYRLLDQKLLLGFKAFFISERTTNSFSYTEDPIAGIFIPEENTAERLSGYADFNLSAEYKFHKNFSVFAIGNNLTNAQYQSYKGYKVLGAQVLAGVKVSF
ncbi:TonB-dependent receptor [Chryseobacterium lacus]|uniref:TonB-dependent receptor n=1 Tax=Chryseobacterium lacus TaxID=2058346 RepID=UPI00162725C5|nr:TonB-dependent receptor [Chryseobacterium lacus]